jgi:hypothetical protein
MVSMMYSQMNMNRNSNSKHTNQLSNGTRETEIHIHHNLCQAFHNSQDKISNAHPCLIKFEMGSHKTAVLILALRTLKPIVNPTLE